MKSRLQTENPHRGAPFADFHVDFHSDFPTEILHRGACFAENRTENPPRGAPCAAFHYENPLTKIPSVEHP